MQCNVEVDYLRDLAETIHDGDAVSRRHKSERYAESSQSGFHAHFDLIKKMSKRSDMVAYRATAMWLDAIYH